MLLPFDAHNHVHMGPSSSLQDLLTLSPPCLSGMALMSTHPRDFPRVLELADKHNNNNQKIVPCIGVHPWFLHELTKEECLLANDNRPKWVHAMELILEEHPNIPVGEIGLDKFHFDYESGELTTPMDGQIQAMKYQFELACIHQRPVSLHCVRAMGPIMDVIQQCNKSPAFLVPPKIYFHAFGGKVGSATQLIKTLENTSKKKKASGGSTRVYFGFAPIVNFQSPKTIQVLQEVGIDRIVLETDHEDARKVPTSMKLGLEMISKALDVTMEELIATTNQNAHDLYDVDLPTTKKEPSCTDEES